MMTDLERWLDVGGAPPEVEDMLRAAQQERQSEQSLQRTLTAIGVAGAVVGVATTGSAGLASVPPAAGAAATAGAVAKSASVAAVLKWGLLVVVGGGVTLASVAGVHRLVSSESASGADAPGGATTTAAGPAARAPGDSEIGSAAREEATQETSTAASEQDRNRTSPTPAVAPSSPATSSLTEEVAALDRARQSLSAGNVAAAERALDDHARRFNRGRLGLEAAYLRMEVAARRGDTATARSLARQLLRRFPKAPQARRARELLGQQQP
jgi:TolA-binding protein